MLGRSTMMKQNLGMKGCRILVEGSNMPYTPEAVDILKQANVIIAPAMAAGAGGEAMKQTFNRALKAANDFGYQKESPEALLHGAVISALLAIAQAMTDQGCV
ncbi:NADP-specific glutamate dehydrogenase-like isoform X3 [Hibiscus syriacus]|uniref:NADP-specific glutamate dehydrogenase-like isoform X3 n=1 Tax=Hibiscus syriacus TaxID=106335 RepID=UPI001923A238|nr:NADP-specific glutamate dehydrogenase-like isoform X3 [Hibiscus syriacus]